MPEPIHITAVATLDVGGRPCWVVRQRRGDGGDHAHVFPPETLAWRAIEYGIDPADTDTLLELILHEPHMASPPAGPGRFSAESRASRLREAKTAVVITSGGGGQPDPLDRIRNRPIGPDIQRIHQALAAPANRTPLEGR